MLAAGIAHGQERQPGQGVNFYGREQEAALGRQLAQEFRKTITPLQNADASDYVKRVGAKLAAQFSGGWTYQIETIREDRGGATHEPVAFPGGFIFVSANLIAAARNEAEFAGMLAHAMAHVAARHGTRLATKSDLAQMAPMAKENAGWMRGSFPGAPVPMGMLAFQRANELEADYLAVQAMAAAGYDPAGLACYLERVQPAPGGRAVSAVFDALPPRDRRVAAIRAEIGKLPAGAYQAGEEFARVQAEVKVLEAAPNSNAPTAIGK
jgi:predicted Zn-dependent protease